MNNNNWKKPELQGVGIAQVHTGGSKIVSKNNSPLTLNSEESLVIRTNTISDLAILFATLPDDMKIYTYGCLKEHSLVIWNILSLGYEADELCFRDYLSWPRNEIASRELDVLIEAFNDDRYDLVPTIRFANRNIENPKDDINETSALYIEFHKRGMAF